MSDSASTAALIQEAFDNALSHHQAGRFEAAEELYRAILQLDAQHADTNYNLGLLAAQFNQTAAALHLFKTALTSAPQEHKFWLSYIEVLVATGEVEAAQEVLQLGHQHGLDLHSETLDHLAQRTVASSTSDSPTPAPATLNQNPSANIGAPPVHHKQPTDSELKAVSDTFQARDFKKLERIAQALIEKYPYALIGWKALSLTYYHTQRLEQALAPTLKQVELQPEDAQMHANLGLILWSLRRLDEAEASFMRSLELDPNVSDTHTNLGNVRKDQGRIDEAMQCYRNAIAIDPKQGVAHSNLGVLQIDKQEFRSAEAGFRKALSVDPTNASALRNLSTVLTKLGNLVEAEAVIRRAMALEPEHTLAYDLLLFLFNYTNVDKSAEGLTLARQYGKLLKRKVAKQYDSWLCDPQAQRLKIGVVSADLKNHPVGHFCESLLSHIDPDRVEFIAYVHMPEQLVDPLTTRLRPHFAAWKSIYRLSDEQAAALIHADGIHVLLDLSGHTSDNRLPVFARKPAPVQASWLGYFATTGVAEMDYLIGDPYLCPVEEENHFTESVWRLPETWLCFTPPQEDVAVSDLPALRNGHITFGCFNNLNKMNDAVVDLWAELLKQLPDARLFLKSPQLRDPDVQAQTQARFANHGIATERLILEGPSPRGEYLATYARVDIALDPFPYPGGATSVEALWMGVPVLTLRGNRFLAHLGESIAHNAGLPDWIASDKADYIAKAIRFKDDLPALAALRHRLRPKMQASPLLDAPRFAHGFMDALWVMWGRRHANPSPAPEKASTAHLNTAQGKHKQPSATDVAKLKQLLQQRRFPELEKQARLIANKYPHAIAGWKALGLAQQHLGRFEEALQATRKLLAILPNEGVTHSNLGLIQLHLGQLQDAETSFLQAIALDPKLSDPHLNLGSLYRQQGKLEDAAGCYQRALALNPSLATAHSNLGIIRLEQQDLRNAESSFRTALAIERKTLDALLGLSSTLVKLGVLGEAETLARRIIALDSDNVQAYSILLFLLNYRSSGHTEEALALAVRYGQVLSKKATRRYTEWLCELQPQCLKIGVVSGDLYNHPVGYFLEGLLNAIDPDKLEIIAYANRPPRREDAMSERLRARCKAWKDIHDLDDAAAAALIHADGIHILLDLAGHTGNTRLPIFAYKSAPIQAAWLGYFATTGVEQMDYLIGDPNVCPPEEASNFTETVWRLPESYLCFTPPDVDIGVNTLPALTNGHITFGCFNNISKLNDAVVALWSRILIQVPGARLLLKARQLADAASCANLRSRFAAHGIDEAQLLLEGPTPRKDYLAAYQRLDIVLDPFPFPGGTTSVEALWMGIPVLTLRGHNMLSHAGENIMRNLGLPEWIAQDEADYAAKAVAFATDRDALAKLRECLRLQALASPMFNASRFARSFEEALWGMWAAKSPFSATHEQTFRERKP